VKSTPVLFYDPTHLMPDPPTHDLTLPVYCHTSHNETLTQERYNRRETFQLTCFISVLFQFYLNCAGTVKYMVFRAYGPGEFYTYSSI